MLKPSITKGLKNSQVLNISGIENVYFKAEKNLLKERLKFVNNFKKIHVTNSIHGPVKN
tara:strand:- start:315 stop:491 length:177 start_codon:yes stop_codon:yes gene_type:complete